jgi:hypothetical protein
MSLENTLERIAVSLEAIYESVAANNAHNHTVGSMAPTDMDASANDETDGEKASDSKSDADAKKGSGSKKKGAGRKVEKATREATESGLGPDGLGSKGSDGGEEQTPEKQRRSDNEGSGPAITKDDIKKLLVSVADKVSGKTAKAILRSYDGVRKLGDLKESDYGDVVKRLEEALEA